MNATEILSRHPCRLREFLLLVCALTMTLHAQDLAPELLPLAAKYKADSAALEAQKAAEIARLAQVYSTTLDATEKMETTAGHLAGITSITQERTDLKKDELKTAQPDDLPKGLHTARKAYLDGTARVVGEFGQRQQRLAADYIRTLSAMQTRVGGNAALSKQIADEKERVLMAAAKASGAGLERQLIGTKWNWDGRFPVTFQRDGKSICKDELTWEVVKPYTIQYRYPNGNHGTIEFDPGMARATITEINERSEKARMSLVRVKE